MGLRLSAAKRRDFGRLRATRCPLSQPWNACEARCTPLSDLTVTPPEFSIYQAPQVPPRDGQRGRLVGRAVTIADDKMPATVEPIEDPVVNGVPDDDVNGFGAGRTPQTPRTHSLSGLSLTEYSANPSPPSEEKRSRIRKMLPEEFILPNGHPDVRTPFSRAALARPPTL